MLFLELCHKLVCSLHSCNSQTRIERMMIKREDWKTKHHQLQLLMLFSLHSCVFSCFVVIFFWRRMWFVSCVVRGNHAVFLPSSHFLRRMWVKRKERVEKSKSCFEGTLKTTNDCRFLRTFQLSKHHPFYLMTLLWTVIEETLQQKLV